MGRQMRLLIQHHVCHEDCGPNDLSCAVLFYILCSVVLDVNMFQMHRKERVEERTNGNKRVENRRDQITKKR